MCAARDTGHELAVERTHVFNRFVALGEKHAAPSPLSPLLAQVAAQLNHMTASNLSDNLRSRSSSACDVPHRPAPPSAPGSRSSSRQSGPPSRPSSAGATRPPTGRSRFLASSRLPAAPPESLANKYRDPVSHYEKKVKFEEAIVAPSDDGVLPLAGRTRGRRRPQPGASSLADYLAADTFDNPFVASESRRDATTPENERIHVSIASAPRDTQSRKSRLDTSSRRIENDNASTEPKTFVLVRFTIDQFVAAGKIQQWFRGSIVRKRNATQKRAAARIQRAFRRFRAACKTAFAVWMLEKDSQGRWHPTSKFAQLSERPTSARLRFSAPPFQVPRGDQPNVQTHSALAHDYTSTRKGEAALVDFHGGVINNLGNVMALFVHEPQLRISVVEEASIAFDELTFEFLRATETVRRKKLNDEELRLRSVILIAATSLVRQLQARRKVILLHDASRQQLLSAEASHRVALARFASISREVFSEPSSRESILNAAQQFFMSIAHDYLHFVAFTQKHQILKASKDVLRRQAVEMLVFIPKITALVEEESKQRDYIALGELSEAVILEEKLLVLHEIRSAVASIIEKVAGSSLTSQ